MKIFLVGCVLILAASATLAQNSSLVLAKTITLPGIQGKFDHFAVDEAGNRLFVAATGSKSLQVVDLTSGNVIQSLTGLGKPHGLAWIASSGDLYLADGEKATLEIFHGTPLVLVKTLPLSEDADDMVYDGTASMLYVGHGGSDTAHPGRIAIIDTKNQTQKATIPTASHPEALEIDRATDRVFANIADAAEIAVIDGKTLTQSAVWKLTAAKDNVPLAYDEEQRILFVACRTPARLLILDGNSGKELAELPSDSGADDLFYDADAHQVYLIAGSGAIDIYKIDTNKSVKATGAIHTAVVQRPGCSCPPRTLFMWVSPAAA